MDNYNLRNVGTNEFKCSRFIKASSRIVSVLVLMLLLSCLSQWPIVNYGLIKLPSFSSCSAEINARSRSSVQNLDSLTAASPINKASGNYENQSSGHYSTVVDQPMKSAAGDSSKPIHQVLHAHGHAHYPFVQFSAYRDSEKTFFLIGITSVVARAFDQPVQHCQWEPHGANKPSVSTQAHMIYVYYDQLPRLYVVTIVNCTFEEEVGVLDEGGSLFIMVSVGPNLGNTEKTLALQEQQGAASDLLQRKNSPPSLRIAFCGPPMHGNLREDWVLHWLVYYHHLWKGKAHFFFYNVGGVTDSLRQIIRPFLEGGYVTIIDAISQKQFPSWYFNQLLFINDCLHMTRYLSSWTFFHDFDEFLYVPLPGTLDQLLDLHKDKSFMTFGSIPSVTSLCSDPPLKSLPKYDWLVQRFLWMQKQPHCVSDEDPMICLHGPGARKYVVNPRKVIGTAVHNTAIPNQEGGIDLNVSIARMYHYHGVLSADTKVCDTKVNVSLRRDELDEQDTNLLQYNRDVSIPKAVAKARKYCASLLKLF